jgi:hypothetical protein
MTTTAKSRTTNPMKALSAPAVSPNNPCPFLRALVANGYIDGHSEPLLHVKGVVAAARGGSALDSRVAGYATAVIAMFSNGLSPGHLFHNLKEGFSADALRGGPLDKRGSGSRILNAQGKIDLLQLSRLEEFAAQHQSADGTTELGLGAAQLKTMMDANFKRAVGARRIIDRQLMDGEWPVLLMVMGKQSTQGPYLSLAEIRTLFVDRLLPERIVTRLEAAATRQ